MQNFIKEVCVDNFTDAVNAFKCGANRIEFCSNLDQDGLTPKIEDLLTLSKTIDIPIRCMLRPHSKSFIYEEDDLKKIVDTIISKPLKLIFHKAIDFTPNFSKSFNSLIDSKLVDGVLTSGGKEKAIDNLELLSKICSSIPKDFEFIACGNITFENYDYIHSIIKSKFYHGKKIIKF